VYTYLAKYLRTYTIIPFIGFETETKVCINGIHTLFLQFVGTHLIHESYTASFLVKVYDNTFTFLVNEFHCLVQL
jgi:hypothetical protein